MIIDNVTRTKRDGVFVSISKAKNLIPYNASIQLRQDMYVIPKKTIFVYEHRVRRGQNYVLFGNLSPFRSSEHFNFPHFSRTHQSEITRAIRKRLFQRVNNLYDYHGRRENGTLSANTCLRKNDKITEAIGTVYILKNIFSHSI